MNSPLEMRAFDLLKQAQQQNVAEFTRVFPNPFLVASLSQEAGHDDYFTSLRSSSRPVEAPGLMTSKIPPGAQVFVVAKRGTCNPYSEMVTIGRAENCDIVLPYLGVSKFHAYIETKRAAENFFFLCDAGSRNGTSLNGRRLVAKQPEPLASFDNLLLGVEVRLTFFLPPGFWSALRGRGTNPPL